MTENVLSNAIGPLLEQGFAVMVAGLLLYFVLFETRKYLIRLDDKQDKQAMISAEILRAVTKLTKALGESD